MSNIIIGTAGHIDHGKTSLVKALTNMNPTRLKEEKQRNMTIDLGFAHTKLNDHTLSFIDLPGHEKFVSNMIVGASNIDMVLFVVAADDGIMPQTKQHFEILSLLNIKHCMIVLTKSDLVTKELLTQRKQEITNFFKDTIFDSSPIVEVSIYAEVSIVRLKQCLVTYIDSISIQRHKLDIFYLSIDRSFSMQGLGCIVTGTPIGNTVSINETLSLYPQDKIVKVRNIQSHSINLETSIPGQRLALQLSNISDKEIKRGDVLASVNSLKASRYLDVKVTNLKSNKVLKNNQLIRLSYQTKEVLGRLKLPNGTLNAGESSYGSLYLQDDIYGLKGSLGILRSFSPIKTIGGIEILSLLDKKPKLIEGYYVKYDNNIDKQIIQLLEDKSYLSRLELEKLYNLDDIENLLNNETLLKFEYNQKDYFILNQSLNDLYTYTKEVLTNYHLTYPLSKGLSINKLEYSLPKKITRVLLSLCNDFKIENDLISLTTFKITYNNEQKKIKNQIMTYIKNNGYSLLTLSDLYNKYSSNEDYLVIQSMIDEGIIVLINQEYLILDRMINDLKSILLDIESKTNHIKLKDFKESINVSRKYVIMILEYFDSIGYTKNEEHYRIIQRKT